MNSQKILAITCLVGWSELLLKGLDALSRWASWRRLISCASLTLRIFRFAWWNGVFTIDLFQLIDFRFSTSVLVHFQRSRERMYSTSRGFLTQPVFLPILLCALELSADNLTGVI